jgi:hypothetical protein
MEFYSGGNGAGHSTQSSEPAFFVWWAIMNSITVAGSHYDSCGTEARPTLFDFDENNPSDTFMAGTV